MSKQSEMPELLQLVVLYQDYDANDDVVRRDVSADSGGGLSEDNDLDQRLTYSLVADPTTRHPWALEPFDRPFDELPNVRDYDVTPYEDGDDAAFYDSLEGGMAETISVGDTGYVAVGGVHHQPSVIYEAGRRTTIFVREDILKDPSQAQDIDQRVSKALHGE